MILVDDHEGPALLDPENPEVLAALDEARAHYEGSDSSAQPPCHTELYGDTQVVAALTELFRGKCAYCESYLPDPAPANVEHVRPTSDAVGLDGKSDHKAYWWLAYRWENLLLSCTECSRAKGRRFPVLGDRATDDDGLLAEHPLLLNPRSPDDNPERWLLFYRDGTVASENERGRATIEVLGLNRSRLVKERRTVAGEVQRQHRARRGAASGSPESYLHEELSFLALRRQLWAELTADASLTPAETAPDSRAQTKVDYAAMSQMRQSNTLSDNLDLVDAGARADYFSGTRWIERIELRNIRPIRAIDLQLNRSQASTAPWMTILGDNGCGKSSMLQAVALALVGADYRRRIGISPDDLLRRGARKGSVKVWLTNLPDPITMEFTRGASEFTGNDAPQVLVLAYGATRLRASATDTPHSEVSHIENLFDARHELTNPEDWLLSLDEATFAAVTQSLHGLLALENGQSIGRDPRRHVVYIGYGRDRDPFKDLSDGYQSMLVLTCDVLRTMMRLWARPDQAEGIVLIDEIGTHLHPRWRMRIVSALRLVLPRIQFVVSTHDPLCLRGLEDGEITVVNRTGDGNIVTITDLPSVKGMRVDQLLTSEHFGLGSAMDPDVDRLYEEYYGLRGEPDPTAAQRQRLAALEDELGRLRQLGVTQREQLMLQTADKLIAERRRRGDAKVPGHLADLMADLWNRS
ncbi:MAG: AAA family ATPase [Micropruina sp.]|nr:AAA family ATPase [Micropruina sp.]